MFGKKRKLHYYIFAHRALPDAVFEHGAIDALTQEDGRERLLALWLMVGDSVGRRRKIPPELDRELLSLHGKPVILVTFPRPKKTPEAYFACIVPGATPHYFTLERGEDVPVLGGWAPGGRHLNFGPCGRRPEDFLDGVARLLKLGDYAE